LLMHGPIEEVYRRIRRNRMIEVRFVSGVEAGVSLLRSSPACRNVDVAGNRAIVELETDDRGVAEILRQLVDAKIEIRSFGEKDPTLEDVFMLVTKGLVS